MKSYKGLGPPSLIYSGVKTDNSIHKTNIPSIGLIVSRPIVISVLPRYLFRPNQNGACVPSPYRGAEARTPAWSFYVPLFTVPILTHKNAWCDKRESWTHTHRGLGRQAPLSSVDGSNDVRLEYVISCQTNLISTNLLMVALCRRYRRRRHHSRRVPCQLMEMKRNEKMLIETFAPMKRIGWRRKKIELFVYREPYVYRLWRTTNMEFYKRAE